MIKKGIEKFEVEAIQLLLESVKDYTIIFINPEGKIQFWNNSAETIFGYKASEIKGSSFLQLYPKEAIDKATPSQNLNKAIEKGKIEVDGWQVRKDGLRFWSHQVITALYEEDVLIGYSIVVRDLSEIKKVENGLTRSDNKYKALVAGVKDYAIFMLDEKGCISSWNEGGKAITGFAEHEVIDKEFSLFFNQHENQEIPAVNYLTLAKRTGRIELEEVMTRKDGSSFFSGTTITVIYDESKKVTGYSVIIKDLTELKHAEEELKLKEERNRLLVEGVKDYAIFMLDPHGYIATWNEGAKRIKGYTGREIIGRHFSIFYPQEAKDQKYPEFELEQAKKFGRFEDEGIRVKKDGSTFYANVVITAIYNKKNQLIGFTKVTRDLTEKKNSEEALRLSEERYRLLIEGVKDYAIFMLDSQGNIATWNEGAKRLNGYNQSEIIGRHFSIFYTQEDKTREYPQYELEQATKFGRYEDEGLRVRKDGTTFYANVVITTIYNSKKELIGFTKITRDLTERREVEEALRLSEEKYRLLIEGVKDYAIFMLDPNGNITTWNEGAKSLQGYNQNEIIGRHFSIFYPQEAKDRKYPEYELEQAIKYGRFEDEGIRIRKDGSSFYANVIITPLYNKQGILIGFSKITRDLTERIENERRLQNLNSELETKVFERTRDLTKSLEDLKRINADLDSFIYTASHDLKAPVSNIEGLIYTLSDILQENEIDKDEVDNIIELMEQSVVKFQGTIKDLTEINISQKNIDEDRVPLKLDELIEDVKISIINLITNSNTLIQVNTYQCPVINFSKKHTKSIIYNLISNAIKYKSPDRDPVIKISSYCESKFSILKIEDNGLGIKEQDKEKIFQMFKRLHDHVEGTGIGLYIVKRIIENAGGKIEVESEVGKGTCFKIYIPV